jgi:hypothetical protein
MQFDDDVIKKYSASDVYYATEYLHNEIKDTGRIEDKSQMTRAANVNQSSLSAIFQTPKAYSS